MFLDITSLISVLMSWGVGQSPLHLKWIWLACWWPQSRKAVVGILSVVQTWFNRLICYTLSLDALKPLLLLNFL